MEKPTLHEIAAMPYPASMLAMREHYNRDWHKDLPEGKKVFRVIADWTAFGSIKEDIEAKDEAEAKVLVEGFAEDDASDGVNLIMTYRSIEQAQP